MEAWVSGSPRRGAAEQRSSGHSHDRGPGAAERADVYLHIGLKKTGTSYLQRVLWLSRERLAATGVLVPGQTRKSQTQAVWDLVGRRLRAPDQAGDVGSWRGLVDAAASWSGSHVVISEETLSTMRPQQVRRAVRAFAPADVHVVITARDLAEVISSTWQQQLSKGHAWSWDEYVGAVRDPVNGPATAGVAFWLGQDLLRVLDTWEKVVPRDRIHLVTVPPADAAPSVLLDRFAVAAKLDAAALVADQAAVNVSVGVTEAEVLRRLNLGLGGRLDEEQYIQAVHKVVKPALRTGASSPRIQLPAEEVGWVTQRATSTVHELQSRGYQVTGDLNDLIPRAPASGGSRRPDQVDDAELVQATSVALVAVTERFGDLWKRTRKQHSPVDAAVAERLVSGARARGYRARIATLHIADRNPLVRRAVHAYLRRSSRADATREL